MKIIFPILLSAFLMSQSALCLTLTEEDKEPLGKELVAAFEEEERVGREIAQHLKDLESKPKDPSKFVGFTPEFLKEMDAGYYRKLFMAVNGYIFWNDTERKYPLLLLKKPASKKEFRERYLCLDANIVDNKNYFNYSKIVNFSAFV